MLPISKLMYFELQLSGTTIVHSDEVLQSFLWNTLTVTLTLEAPRRSI